MFYGMLVCVCIFQNVTNDVDANGNTNNTNNNTNNDINHNANEIQIKKKRTIVIISRAILRVIVTIATRSILVI